MAIDVRKALGRCKELPETHRPEVYLIAENCYFLLPPYLVEDLSKEVIRSAGDLDTMIKVYTEETKPAKKLAIINEKECLLYLPTPSGKINVAVMEGL